MIAHRQGPSDRPIGAGAAPSARLLQIEPTGATVAVATNAFVTMLILDTVVGLSACPTFPGTFDLGLVRALRIDTPWHRRHLERLREIAIEKGRTDVVRTSRLRSGVAQSDASGGAERRWTGSSDGGRSLAGHGGALSSRSVRRAPVAKTASGEAPATPGDAMTEPENRVRVQGAIGRWRKRLEDAPCDEAFEALWAEAWAWITGPASTAIDVLLDEGDGVGRNARSLSAALAGSRRSPRSRAPDRGGMELRSAGLRAGPQRVRAPHLRPCAGSAPARGLRFLSAVRHGRLRSFPRGGASRAGLHGRTRDRGPRRGRPCGRNRPERRWRP